MLIEHFDIDLTVVVLAQNLLCVVLRVERVHEHERDVDFVRFVQVFDLLNGQIEKVKAGTNRNERFGSGASHRRSQATVKLDNDKFRQEGFFVSGDFRHVGRFNVIVFFNLKYSG